MKRIHSIGALTCALALGGGAGCVADLDQAAARDERRALPESFRKTDAPPAELAAVKTKAAPSVATQKRWNAFFTDPHLQSLVKSALENNQELGMRFQENFVARNEVAARRGEILPKFSLGTGAGIEKVGKYTSQGASDEAHGVPEHLPDFQFGLKAQWEVDIWHKLQNAADAANNRFVASIEGQRFMVTEVVAEIAKSYYELLALDAQLDVLGRNIKLQEDGLAAVQLKKLAGRATQLAVQKFEAEILKNKAGRFALEQRRVLVENRINSLVGRYPQSVERNAQTFSSWTPPPVEAGLPTELLSNRLDVREAEAELKGAKLDVEVAKAKFYPSLAIDFRVGFQAFNPMHLIAIPESLLYDFAGNLMVPLLNRAAITAEYRAANARQIQAVLNYEKTLLVAFTDVANQLASIDNLNQQFDQQSKQVQTLKDAVEVSNLLYWSARADYMEVLLTRRDAVDAEMDLIETKLEQMQTIVGVYQALGGGWR